MKQIKCEELEQLNLIKMICQDSDYEIFQDETLMSNAKIGAAQYNIDISHCTPTFILKADQKFLAIIVQGNRKLDFKKLKNYLNTNKIRMATVEEVFEVTNTPIGSVSMINSDLRTLIDLNISNLDYCYGGCGIEKHTLKIRSKDLIKVSQAEVGDFSTQRV